MNITEVMLPRASDMRSNLVTDTRKVRDSFKVWNHPGTVLYIHPVQLNLPHHPLPIDGLHMHQGVHQGVSNGRVSPIQKCRGHAHTSQWTSLQRFPINVFVLGQGKSLTCYEAEFMRSRLYSTPSLSMPCPISIW